MKKKKKKKLNYKNIVIVLILFVLFIVLAHFIIRPILCKTMLKGKGYSNETSEYIFNNSLTKLMLDNDYSKTIDYMIKENKYKEDYDDKYREIEYQDNSYFINTINNLIINGYTTSQINSIYKENSEDFVTYLVLNKVEDIDKYIEVDIFKSDRISRYLTNKKDSYKNTILYVNMDRDKAYFEEPNIIDKYSIDMLVNKHNKLVSDYNPELVLLDKCSTGENYLTKEAKEAYDKMCNASKKEGLSLGVTSSYRSYKDQEETYNYYKKKNGEKYARDYVAVPGFSEHQTGLALDIKSTYTSPFKTSKEYKWVINNAHKYGYILRYPENKEDLTGYGAESWHFRYVGTEIAKYIYENDITFEEYYALFIDK